MLFSRVAPAAILTLVAIAVAPSVHARSVQALSPRTISIRLADLPAGFKVATAHAVSNQQKAIITNIKKQEFDAHGRMKGYEKSFISDHATGVVSIVAYTDVYRAAAGAQWDYVHAVRHDLTRTRHVPAPKIGDESTGLVYSAKSESRSYTVYLIAFRRGPISVTVGIGGLTGHVTVSDAVKYARIVAGRIP